MPIRGTLGAGQSRSGNADGRKEMKAMRAMSQTPATMAEGRTSRTRLMIGVTLVLLLDEFLLGLCVNLFVPTPHGQPVLFAHIFLGTLLLVVALATTIVAVAGRGRATTVLSAAGLVFLLVAWIGGERFLSGGGHSTDSYVIAAGFVLAAACYVVARDLDLRGVAS
jgi:hypothetical protein